MIFYVLYINDLVEELNGRLETIKSLNEPTGCIGYADDIALISVSREGTQQLIDIAYRYCKKWRFSFNPSKCSVIKFSSDMKKNE